MEFDMYKVKVENSCRCFLKSGMAEILEFDREDEAKKEAEAMLEKMNSTFCHKHKFVLNEKFGDYTIFIQSK
jgi:hypothetical protein